MKALCVYCGSNPGNNPQYLEGALALADELCRQNLNLVYGGAKVGLMGALADRVLEQGGQVLGVMPKALVAKEIAHRGLTELHEVESMHERKAKMAELADGFIALPGGLGTLEEIFEMLTWAQLGFHKKSCGFLNIAGYYDGLSQFLGHAVLEGFIKKSQKSLFTFKENPAELLEHLMNYKPPSTHKWIGKRDL